MCISNHLYDKIGSRHKALLPKYDGFHKKTILFTRKVTWVIF